MAPAAALDAAAAPRKIDTSGTGAPSGAEPADPLAGVLDAIGDPVVVVSAVRDAAGAIVDLEVLHANAAWREAVALALGTPDRPADDPVGRSLYEVFPPGTVRRELHARVIEQRTVEVSMIPAGDRWEEMRFSPLGDGFVMVARDVTERVSAVAAQQGSDRARVDADRARVASDRARIEAEAARETSEARMATVVALAPYAILIHENQVITFANQAALQLFAADHMSQLVGHRIFEFIHPDHHAATFERIGQVLESHKATERFHQRYVRLDGEPIDVEGIALAFPSDDDITRIMVFAYDVTDQRRLDAAVAEANERLERAQVAAGVGLWDWDMATDRLSWSPELYRLFGLDPARGEATFEIWAGLLHPADASGADIRLAESVANGTPLDSEYRIIRPDGTVRWIQALGHTFAGDDGRPRKMAGICLDVTDRKRAEIALENTARLLVDSQRAAGIGSYRADFVSNRWDSSEVLDEIFGINRAFDHTIPGWESLVHPDDREMAARYLAEDVVAGGRPFDLEYRIVRPSDGAIRWVHGLGEVTLDATGQALALTGTIQDVTERRLAADERERLAGQLQDAQRMEAIGRLAGGIAHDFNNMLGAILGYTELAMARVQPGDELHADLTEIHRAATRSADLTRQLLAYARRETTAPRVIDLNATVEADLKMLRRLMGENVEIAWSPGRDAGHVRLDPGQLDRLLTNLCVNARDAMDGDGAITIETGRVELDDGGCAGRPGCTPGTYATLAVSDTGRGMDPAVLANVFEPFFTTKGVGQGTGLGLAMVHGIVTGAGGFIGVTSEPGVGSTFTIHLPSEEPEAGPSEAVLPAERAAAQATILVVEDEPALLALAARVLRKLGYAVLSAGTAAEALAHCDAAVASGSTIDLVLTDVVMPGMSGPDMANAIRERCPNLRFVFMSGYPTESIARSGGLPAGSGFLAKPFSVAALAGAVHDALDAG